MIFVRCWLGFPEMANPTNTTWLTKKTHTFHHHPPINALSLNMINPWDQFLLELISGMHDLEGDSISTARHSPSGPLHNYFTAWHAASSCHLNYLAFLLPNIKPWPRNPLIHCHISPPLINHAKHRLLLHQWFLTVGRPPRHRRCRPSDPSVSSSTLHEPMMLIFCQTMIPSTSPQLRMCLLHWANAKQEHCH